jgi:hypothetical protein
MRRTMFSIPLVPGYYFLALCLFLSICNIKHLIWNLSCNHTNHLQSCILLLTSHHITEEDLKKNNDNPDYSRFRV